MTETGSKIDYKALIELDFRRRKQASIDAHKLEIYDPFADLGIFTRDKDCPIWALPYYLKPADIQENSVRIFDIVDENKLALPLEVPRQYKKVSIVKQFVTVDGQNGIIQTATYIGKEGWPDKLASISTITQRAPGNLMVRVSRPSIAEAGIIIPLKVTSDKTLEQLFNNKSELGHIKKHGHVFIY